MARAWLLCQWVRQLYNVAIVCRFELISTNARARSKVGVCKTINNRRLGSAGEEHALFLVSRYLKKALLIINRNSGFENKFNLFSLLSVF